MRCPNCGSPVIAANGTWQCTWCGDFGSYVARRKPRPTDTTIPLRATVTVPDLPQPQWYDLADEPEEAPADGGPFLSYCRVKVEGFDREYAYLMGDLAVCPGDLVEVPFGKDNALKQGVVTRVDEYTPEDAPWPPEDLKSILRVVEKA